MYPTVAAPTPDDEDTKRRRRVLARVLPKGEYRLSVRYGFLTLPVFFTYPA
jgi:hypothetical protein